MWMYKTRRNNNSIILSDYKQIRSISSRKNFLTYYSEYLQTHDYTGYNKVEKVKIMYFVAV